MKVALTCLILLQVSFGVQADIIAGNGDLSPSVSKVWTADPLARHACLFERAVVVVGASVSEDEGNPIEQIRLASAAHEPLRNVAVSGASSDEVLPLLNEGKLKGAGTVFAIDVFYWDAFRPRTSCEDSLSRLASLVKKAKDAKFNLVLGTIPDNRGLTGMHAIMIPKSTACQARLNQSMSQLCQSREGCYLIEAKTLAERTWESGLTFRGRNYHMTELRPDGIHLSKVGAEIYAEEILKLFDVRPPVCNSKLAAADLKNLR